MLIGTYNFLLVELIEIFARILYPSLYGCRLKKTCYHRRLLIDSANRLELVIAVNLSELNKKFVTLKLFRKLLRLLALERDQIL